MNIRFASMDVKVSVFPLRLHGVLLHDFSRRLLNDTPLFGFDVIGRRRADLQVCGSVQSERNEKRFVSKIFIGKNCVLRRKWY
jgi:hypothetical protein